MLIYRESEALFETGSFRSATWSLCANSILELNRFPFPVPSKSTHTSNLRCERIWGDRSS
jgi:hypothetical protein